MDRDDFSPSDRTIRLTMFAGRTRLDHSPVSSVAVARLHHGLDADALSPVPLTGEPAAAPDAIQDPRVSDTLLMLLPCALQPHSLFHGRQEQDPQGRHANPADPASGRCQHQQGRPETLRGACHPRGHGGWPLEGLLETRGWPMGSGGARREFEHEAKPPACLAGCHGWLTESHPP